VISSLESFSCSKGTCKDKEEDEEDDDEEEDEEDDWISWIILRRANELFHSRWI
jgi:hypothetical protein